MQIKFNTNPNNKKEAVFVLIHADIRPFLHYDSPKHDRSQRSKAFIVSNRRDNTKGFIGGTLDNGEDIIEGLKREIDEEYGFDIDLNQLVPLCSHESKKVVSHLFEYEVDEIEFFNILSQINKNFSDFFHNHTKFLSQYSDEETIEDISREKFGISHYFSEIRNVEAIYLSDRKYDMENLFENKFVGSGKQELEIFLKKYYY